jgi:hypothetical protein
MPSCKPLVISSGSSQQLQSGDFVECDGVLLKGTTDANLRSNAGTIEARNSGNSAMAPLSCSNLIASGDVDARGLIHLPLGQPEGLTLSRNATNPTTHIDIAAGRAVLEYSSNRYICIRSSSYTKRLDATWASGNGNGGRFSGSLAANTWYHVFLMRNLTGSIEFGFDTSVTGANKPTGWQVRRIGSVRTDGSSQIIDFVQVGNVFYWASEREDVRTAIGTTATLYTLSVPIGINIEAIVRIASGNPASGNAAGILLSSPLISDQAPSRLGGGPASVECGFSNTVGNPIEFEQSATETLLTNSSAQIRARSTYSGSYSNNPRIGTIGWYDPRGER